MKADFKYALKRFTLIEVTMAIAVISIGMVGILALFPIGLQASRNAIANNYAAIVGRQMLEVVSMQVKAYSDSDGGATKDGWGEWITGDASVANPDLLIPDKKVDTSNTTSQENRLNDVKAEPGAELIPGVPGIYFPIDKGTAGQDITDKCGIFYLESRSDRSVDFSAVAALWQGATTYDLTNDGNMDDLPIEFATTIYLEISWPVSAPYVEREKRRYALSIFNPVAR